jgi:hypothetical protein
MADEQPNTPSTESERPDGPAPDSTSTDAETQPSGSSSNWFQRMFRRGSSAGGDAEGKPGTGESDLPGPSSKALTLTEDELERRIQAETDRRETKRAAEAKARAKRELRDKDPWAYAEEERKEERAHEGSTELATFVTSIGTELDRVSIDPVFLSLPEAERERIQKLDGAGQGLEGRKLVVTESLKALEKHWKAEGAKDAEAKLRRNPAFRKQVLTELRGQTPEPELLPSGSASDADHTVSGLLRDYYRLG